MATGMHGRSSASLRSGEGLGAAEEWLPHANTLRPMHDIRTIGHLEAAQAIEVIVAEATQRGVAVVVAAADAFGEIIAVLRMDRASVSSVNIAQHKAFTAAREGRPSGMIGAQLRDPRNGYDISFHGDPRYIGWAGGVPIIVDGACVGAIAVSGLSEADDVALAALAIAAITGVPVAATADSPSNGASSGRFRLLRAVRSAPSSTE